jgi:hypothetical protein
VNASPSPILLGQRAKVYTYATPSHLPLLREHFLPSFPFSVGVDLHIEMMPQECATGDYMAAGWNATMLRKLELCIAAADSAEHIVAVVDCDVRWHGSIDPVLECIERDTIVGHFDAPGVFCAGVMFFRPSDLIRRVFARAYALLVNDRVDHDQTGINVAAREKGVNLVAHPAIWSHGCVKPGRWEPGLPLPEAPQNMILHHANWCVGVENKAKLLREIAHRRLLS